MNLNQVTVPALDVDASVAFYERLGLRLIVRAQHYARFECPEGPATFSVHLAAALATASPTVVYFECDQLDETVDRLRRAGLAFSQEPRNMPWLWREARIADPAGNVVCLYRAGENRLHPPWRLDGTGPRPARPAPRIAPDLCRTWLFGPGADTAAHEAMARSGADALIVDLEDFTPPGRRDEARRGLPALLERWRGAGCVAAVRINALDGEGPADLAAAMPARPDIVAYPMAATATQMRELDTALADWESRLGIAQGSTGILPVCETALGVVDVRTIAAASPRIRAALLGAEDLAADLHAERAPDAVELDHARRRFVLECRAAAIEPIDAPCTYADIDGAVREARYARRLGYGCKALVRPEHAEAVNAALTPDAEERRRAAARVEAFEAARARGEERALVDGLWVEVPTYRNAQRLLERSRRLEARG